MKKKELIIIGIIVAVVIAIVCLLKYLRKQALLRQSAKDEDKALPAISNSLCTKGNNFPLQYGSCGSNVSALQTELGNITVDGKFGNQTKSRLFQVTGKYVISEVEFNTLRTGNMIPNGTSIGGSTALTTPSTAQFDRLVTDVKADEGDFRMLPRTDSTEPYRTLNNLSLTDLGKVADSYKSAYSKSLYATIKGLSYYPASTVNDSLLAKLEKLGKVS